MLSKYTNQLLLPFESRDRIISIHLSKLRA